MDNVKFLLTVIEDIAEALLDDTKPTKDKAIEIYASLAAAKATARHFEDLENERREIKAYEDNQLSDKLDCIFKM